MDKMAAIQCIFIIIAFIPGSSCDQCSMVDLLMCLKPIIQFWQVEGIDFKDTQFALFNLSVNKVDHYCSLFSNESSVCLTEVSLHCSGDNKAFAEGIREANKFMCGKGFNEFLHHKGCLVQQLKPIDRCKTAFDQEFRNSSQWSPEEAEQRLCKAMTGALDCQRAAVDAGCGTEAMQWFVTYKTLMSRPSEENYHCHTAEERPLEVNASVHNMT